jgi:glycosyltransferase involved in cell wall biosynthesis
LRITFLSPRSNLSGGLRVIATYAQMLRDRGHQVSIVTPAKRKVTTKTWVKSLLQGRVPETDSDMGGHFQNLTVPVCEAHCDDFLFNDNDVPDADVIIATWWETAFAVAAMPPEKGRKCYLIQGHEVFDPLPWQISRATYFLPLQPLVIASWLEDVLRQDYNRDDAILVPNGTDLSQFNAEPRNKSSIPHVGFLYSTSPIKGTKTVLAAIEHLLRDFPDLHVVAFGTEAVSDDLPLPPNSTYHRQPEQDFIRNIYSDCDVFLGGSTSEGFFLPLLEAMACRTPVVSTRVGAAPDLITDGQTGYVVDVGDETALAQAAATILNLSNDDWKNMSQACVELAQNNGWEQACDRIEHVLETLVNGDPA